MRAFRGWVLMPLSCLVFGAVASAQVNLGSEEQRAEGEQLYQKFCSQCHGTTGDGIGYATYRVKPLPRDFTSGKYKFRSTPSGKLPTDADLIRVIKDGLPYTSMPGWPQFTDAEIQSIVHYLKTFSADWENPEMYGEPLQIPAPPEISEASIERGKVVYVEQGCVACHGAEGLGDGLSARTLVDDWNNHLWPADMSYRWTFRGGSSREDIFRTFSTGLNGTPMPSYGETLPIEDRWHLVNYIYSLGDGDDPSYAELLSVAYADDELDLDNAELFAAAQTARFPLVGQIMEVGRNFYPSAIAVEVRAVYNAREIAIEVKWHDKIADQSGTNAPNLVVPPWDEDNEIPEAGAEGETGDGSFWGDDVEEEEGDFWGEEGDDGGDFWGDEEGGAEGGGFSDAVALQFPGQLPTGARKPYFIFGDASNPVDLWFVDLATSAIQQYSGRGSDNLEINEADEFETRASYEGGVWTVLFKRERKGLGGVSFEPQQFVPLGFSVWDGFNRERGNKRALSSWFHLYLEPQEKPTPWLPMLRAFFITLVIEIVAIFWLRRRSPAESAEPVAAEQAAAGRVS